jgi:hypothetical protein
MPALIAWGLTNLPVAIPVAISILSSLIVGLTPYPKAGGFVKTLSVVANLLSLVVHKDSPATFKLPLMQSPAPGADVNALSFPIRAAP